MFYSRSSSPSCFSHRWPRSLSGFWHHSLSLDSTNCTITWWPHFSGAFKTMSSSRIHRREEECVEDHCIRSSSVFSSDVNITERQAQALANYIRSNGTSVLRQARSLFLWNNLTNSILVSPRLLLEKRNDRDVSSSSGWFCSFHSTLACRWTHWPSRWLVWSSYSLSRRSTKSTKFPSIVPRSKSSIKSINYWRSKWSVVEDERMNERRSSFRLTSKGSVKPKKA